MMTSTGESSTEARRPTESLLKPKEITSIENWNVRTMYAIGKSAAQIAKEMREYRIDILGNVGGSEKLKLSTGETVINFGRDDGMHRNGVALMISKIDESAIWNGYQ